MLTSLPIEETVDERVSCGTRGLPKGIVEGSRGIVFRGLPLTWKTGESLERGVSGGHWQFPPCCLSSWFTGGWASGTCRFPTQGCLPCLPTSTGGRTEPQPGGSRVTSGAPAAERDRHLPLS